LVLRKVCFLLALALTASVGARAQILSGKIDLFTGYGFMHFKSTPAANLNGFDVAAKYKVLDWRSFEAGVAADVGGEYGTVNDISSHLYTYTFGPEVSWTPHRFVPFAHVLIGGSHYSGAFYTSKGVAYTLGAGVDYKAKKKMSWRIIEIDDLPTHLGGHDQHSTRISTGLVFHF